MLKNFISGLASTKVIWGMVLSILLLFGLALFLVAYTGSISTPSSGAPPVSALTPSLTPATFQITELRINPTEVDSKGGVTITAKVRNISGTDGIYNADLQVNGISEVREKVVVAAGGEELLSFLVSKDIPGTYKVTLGELAGQFVVVKPTEPAPSSSSASGNSGSAGASCCPPAAPTTSQSSQGSGSSARPSTRSGGCCGR